MGFWKVWKNYAKGFLQNTYERITFIALFLGIFFTGIGSAYYHLDPNNLTLIWDRIPMTIVFASMISLIVMYKIDFKTGFWILLPLIMLGIWTVLYWSWTDDLRPYAFMQYFSLILIPLILYLFPRDHRPITNNFVWAFIFYALAKVFESTDSQLYHLTGGISGHCLKHILASLGAFCLVALLEEKQTSKICY